MGGVYDCEYTGVVTELRINIRQTHNLRTITNYKKHLLLAGVFLMLYGNHKPDLV